MHMVVRLAPEPIESAPGPIGADQKDARAHLTLLLQNRFFYLIRLQLSALIGKYRVRYLCESRNNSLVSHIHFVYPRVSHLPIRYVSRYNLFPVSYRSS
jgi:hypothetical protein